MKVKRLIIAIVWGIVFGFVCFGLASSGSGKLAWPVAVQMIASRTMIGFAIGISSFYIVHWSVHGIVLGLLFSLPLAFSWLMVPENPEFSKGAIFISTLVAGLIYGFLIELFTSVVFKARIQS